MKYRDPDVTTFVAACRAMSAVLSKRRISKRSEKDIRYIIDLIRVESSRYGSELNAARRIVNSVRSEGFFNPTEISNAISILADMSKESKEPQINLMEIAANVKISK